MRKRATQANNRDSIQTPRISFYQCVYKVLACTPIRTQAGALPRESYCRANTERLNVRLALSLCQHRLDGVLDSQSDVRRSEVFC